MKNLTKEEEIKIKGGSGIGIGAIIGLVVFGLAGLIFGVIDKYKRWIGNYNFDKCIYKFREINFRNRKIFRYRY